MVAIVYELSGLSSDGILSGAMENEFQSDPVRIPSIPMMKVKLSSKPSIRDIKIISTPARLTVKGPSPFLLRFRNISIR
ncbi:MAG TPA: hypothetical protein VK957_06605 [Lunatimonas sp.]|nr:hypothetical protein [Lunatimonas sp.]